MEQLSEDELDIISLGRCPKCRNRGFVVGPQGAQSTNIECASEDCRQRFNVAFYGGRAMMGQTLPVGPLWPNDPSLWDDARSDLDMPGRA